MSDTLRGTHGTLAAVRAGVQRVILASRGLVLIHTLLFFVVAVGQARMRHQRDVLVHVAGVLELDYLVRAPSDMQAHAVRKAILNFA